MVTGIQCPSPADLEAYARDQLSPDLTPPLDRHLATCATCLESYVKLGRDLPVPEIPGCHVVKEIGRGRFGVVYKAWRLGEKPRIVALKVLRAVGELEKSRFDREISVLQRIDSPWIVKCLESGESGDAKYLLMEFVEGVHLDEYLLSSTKGLTERLGVLQRVCRAVADAHEKGVVHRDLKPRNILIDDAGQPHILDFGICAVDPADWTSLDRLTITQAGDVIGTLKYMSPEQAWGGVAGAVDERSDLWSLGIMLYEAVTDGDYPYAKGSTPDKPAHEALLERIRKELPRLPRLAHLPRGRDLEILLERCLAWEPEQRISSARLLADDLARYAGGERIRTRPHWWPYRLKRLAVGAATRSRWVYSAAFVAMLAIILAASMYLFNVGWHVEGSRYRASAGAPVATSETTDVRDDFLIVGVFDDTVPAVVDVAAQQGLSEVTQNVTTWRPVHGRFMERLAEARPRAVVWDYYFRSSQPGDGALLQGIERLEAAGVPVALAADEYDDDGTPALSPALIEALGRRLRHGAIVARDMVDRPGDFVLAFRRGESTAVPSLALVALASVLHPEARLDLDWSGEPKPLGLLYQLGPGAYLRERDEMHLARVYKAPAHSIRVKPGDALACARFNLQRPESWEARTAAYQALLGWTDEELRAAVEDKLVIVGDMRARRFGFAADRHPVKYGTDVVDDVPGVYLLADAIANMLEQSYMRAGFPPVPVTFLSMMMIGVVGCLLPIRVAGWTWLETPGRRRLLGVTTAGLAAACFAAMVLTKSEWTVHLAMAGFCLLAPASGCLWVEFARNRHRILERSRRAIEGFGLSSAGTVTLTSKRPTTLRESQ